MWFTSSRRDRIADRLCAEMKQSLRSKRGPLVAWALAAWCVGASGHAQAVRRGAVVTVSVVYARVAVHGGRLLTATLVAPAIGLQREVFRQPAPATCDVNLDPPPDTGLRLACQGDHLRVSLSADDENGALELRVRVEGNGQSDPPTRESLALPPGARVVYRGTDTRFDG